MLCIDDIQLYELMIYRGKPENQKTCRFVQKILDILEIYGIITSQYNFCSFPCFCIKREKLHFFIYGENSREARPKIANYLNKGEKV